VPLLHDMPFPTKGGIVPIHTRGLVFELQPRCEVIHERYKRINNRIKVKDLLARRNTQKSIGPTWQRQTPLYLRSQERQIKQLIWLSKENIV